MIKAAVLNRSEIVCPDDRSGVIGDLAKASTTGQGLFQGVRPGRWQAEHQLEIFSTTQAPAVPEISSWPILGFW